MNQQSFSDIEYSMRKKTTKREEFLNVMEEIIPWDEWVEYIRPYYPNSKRGRPAKGIEKMLRMYLLQIWFSYRTSLRVFLLFQAFYSDSFLPCL